MHIHGNLMNLSAMNPYSAAADRAIVSAQKAASVRKKLTTAAAEAGSAASSPPSTLSGGSSSSTEALMVANWAKPGNVPDDEYHAADTGKDSDFG